MRSLTANSFAGRRTPLRRGSHAVQGPTTAPKSALPHTRWTAQQRPMVLNANISDQDSIEETVEEVTDNKPFFNDAFKGVLKGALDRQGVDALVSGEPEPERVSAQEEILLGALQNSRRSLLALRRMKKDLEASIAREETQFERIHFALQKARGNVAYIKTLENMLQDAKEQ